MSKLHAIPVDYHARSHMRGTWTGNCAATAGGRPWWGSVRERAGSWTTDTPIDNPMFSKRGTPRFRSVNLNGPVHSICTLASRSLLVCTKWP